MKRVVKEPAIYEETRPHNAGGVAYIVSKAFAAREMARPFPIREPSDVHNGHRVREVQQIHGIPQRPHAGRARQMQDQSRDGQDWGAAAGPMSAVSHRRSCTPTGTKTRPATHKRTTSKTLASRGGNTSAHSTREGKASRQGGIIYKSRRSNASEPVERLRNFFVSLVCRKLTSSHTTTQGRQGPPPSTPQRYSGGELRPHALWTGDRPQQIGD